MSEIYFQYENLLDRFAARDHIGAERLGDGKRQLGRVASMLSGMRGYLDEK